MFDNFPKTHKKPRDNHPPIPPPPKEEEEQQQQQTMLCHMSWLGGRVVLFCFVMFFGFIEVFHTFPQTAKKARTHKQNQKQLVVFWFLFFVCSWCVLFSLSSSFFYKTCHQPCVVAFVMFCCCCFLELFCHFFGKV